MGDLRPTWASQPTLLSNLRLPLTSNQLPSPLRPTRLSSNNTPPVFWTPSSAEPTSITPSPLLDTVPKTDKSTTSSETHGVPHGETKDTSRSPLSRARVSAVSKCNLSTQKLPTEI